MCRESVNSDHKSSALRYLGVGKHATIDDAAIVPHPVQHVIICKGEKAAAPRRVACAREAHCCAVKVDGLVCARALYVCVCRAFDVCLFLFSTLFLPPRFPSRSDMKNFVSLMSLSSHCSSCYLVPAAHDLMAGVRVIHELHCRIRLRLICAELVDYACLHKISLLLGAISCCLECRKPAFYWQPTA